MTLPVERTRSVLHTREFLLELLDEHVTPRVPYRLRERARALLRHYPDNAHFADRSALLDSFSPDVEEFPSA